ncbi:MAG: AHH domain-containing protein [Agarilytica sp.]
MTKNYQEVTKYEFQKGLAELESAGELSAPKEQLFNEVILNTEKAYVSRGRTVQQPNAKLARQQAKNKQAKPRSNSKILRENMIKAGRPLPAGTDAHHIVPSSEKRDWAKDNAAAARAILTRWGIDINHEANGVALPSRSDTPVKELPDAYPHKTVHTKVYYLNIAGQLGQSSSQSDCIDILREIGEDLEDGIFPIRK